MRGARWQAQPVPFLRERNTSRLSCAAGSQRAGPHRQGRRAGLCRHPCQQRPRSRGTAPFGPRQGQPWGQMCHQGLKPNFTEIEQVRVLLADENLSKKQARIAPLLSPILGARPAGRGRIAPSDFTRLSSARLPAENKPALPESRSVSPHLPSTRRWATPGPDTQLRRPAVGPRGAAPSTCFDSGLGFMRGTWLDARSSPSPSLLRCT